jgi:AAA+ ATPase superfamily predicted ATPase
MQEQRNPFKYGVPVSKEDFVDREEECKELRGALLSGQSVILYSPRKMGKTSLVKQTELLIPKKEAVVAYIDLFGISSEKELVKKIINSLFRTAYPKLSAFKEAVEKILRKIPTKITILKGAVTVELLSERTSTIEELEEAFDLPERIAENIKRRVIVVFDEFQDVTDIDGAKIEKLMRSKFQHHKNVSYLFAGSKTSLMRAIFAEPTQAFYRFGRTMKISYISKEDFSWFIKKKFESTGKKITQETVEKILTFTNGHPYFTQKLCWHLWYICRERAEEKDVNMAIERAIISDAEFYEEIWSSLTVGQRNLIRGLVLQPKANKYSVDFISTFNLRSAGYVKRALVALEKKRILENGEITDVFFFEWIKKREI